MNNLFQAGKDALKDKLKKKIVLTVIPVIAPYLLVIVGGIIIVMMFLAPIVQALEYIDNFKNAVAGFFEKTGNFLSGRGFQEIDMDVVKLKEGAFNKELGNQYELYYSHGVEIDAPLILATIYYPLNVSYDEGTVQCLNNMGETTETTAEECKKDNVMAPEDQYDYWKNKQNKLPILIKNSISMITTEYSCESVTATVNGESKTVYVQGDRVGNPVTTYPFDGTFRTDGVCNSNSNIKRYTYQANKEEYDKYLIDEYIVNSPEYKFPDNISNEKEKQERLRQIVIAIHDLAKLYYDLFEPPVVAQQVYGAIPYNILTQMVPPVDSLLGTDGKANYRITSCFSPYRELNNGQKKSHTGIDLNTRTPDKNIRAVADGIVAQTVGTNNFNCYDSACANSDSRGNYVTISHEIDGVTFTTSYFHLASVSVSVADVVKAGDIIAVMGNTGNSSGQHLHFQYTDDRGNLVNPGNLFTNPYQINPDSGCSVLSVDCANRNSAVAISPLYGKWNGSSYPINVKINGMTPIPLEQYILGVALNEVPASYNVEAIKAQLITARTYTFGGGRYKQFKLQEAQNQIVIDMGVASETTQTFNLNRLCQLSANYQSNMIQSLEATRGQVLIGDNSKEMFSTEYSSCAANDGYQTLGNGYVCKLPGCTENVQSYCTSNSCNQDGRNVCGHGRGMSQIGANDLANNYSYNYTSILAHYYSAQISDLNSVDLSKYQRE